MPKIVVFIQKTCPNCQKTFIPKVNSIVKRKQAVCCSKHCSYQYKTRVFSNFFWANIEKTESGCWLWTGTVPCTPNGHALVWWQEKHRYLGAHRAAYELHYGDCDPALFVCHTCDVPLCVNPAHLFLGTPKDNTQDALRKGRLGRNAKRGVDCNFTKLTIQQVREIRTQYASGTVNQTQLSKTFEIDPTTVWAIIHRKSWKHVP